MNYYNEFDAKAAVWLRQLIADKLIPAGVVDTRSITDVQPSDLNGFTQCHFFAGIGGWSYALQLAGWPVDRPIWTGSCPCQPFSSAGAQLGFSDERHLWPHFFRLINVCRPPVVAGEQVSSKVALEWLDGVYADLEGAGYACAAADLCAAGVGAPHIRQRLYWVAYAQSLGLEGSGSEDLRGSHEGVCAGRNGFGRCGSSVRLAHADITRSLPTAHAGIHCREEGTGSRHGEFVGRSNAGGLGDTDISGSQGWGLQSGRESGGLSPWSANFDVVHCTDGKARRFEPESFPLADGFPARVGLLRGYGNAIVPQVAAQFIQAAEEARTFEQLAV